MESVEGAISQHPIRLQALNAKSKVPEYQATMSCLFEMPLAEI
jgi:hypothetical protein